MEHPRPLFRLFSVFFKEKSMQILQQINVKRVHPVYGLGIRTHDLQIASLIPLPQDQGYLLSADFICIVLSLLTANEQCDQWLDYFSQFDHLQQSKFAQ